VKWMNGPVGLQMRGNRGGDLFIYQTDDRGRLDKLGWSCGRSGENH